MKGRGGIWSRVGDGRHWHDRREKVPEGSEESEWEYVGRENGVKVAVYHLFLEEL